MSIWRSAGWPCRDAIELDVLAAGWAELTGCGAGIETLRVTDAGIRLLAEARQRRTRARSAHDRLADRMCAHLAAQGRIVWRELSLRARVASAQELAPEADELEIEPPVASAHTQGAQRAGVASGAWRMARPDVFSVRNTSVEGYLQPMVHEVKASRADLLCDLRNEAKRESYRWLSCETYYVFPAGVAQPQDIPDPFGVWVLTGDAESGVLELARPARHAECKLPFAVWMALARATPVQVETGDPQGELAPVQSAPRP
jgi:hypothetical protein